MSYQTMEWFDNASGGTPLSAENLNNMIEGIDEALAREIDFESLTQEVQDIINSKMGFGFCPTDSGTFNSYTDPNKIYTTTHTDGVEYTFFTVKKSDNTLKAQFRFSVNGIEMRIYTNSWGSWKNTSEIEDNSITDEKLSTELQEKIDLIPETPTFISDKGALSAANTFNSSDYCILGAFYQFTAAGTFASEIGVDDGDECEMRYVGGYQVVTKIATQEVFLRQIYRVVPTFLAGEWAAA